MNALFADTFFWIALTDFQDHAHDRARAFAKSASPGTICTTQEVLTEYLNYFAAWGQRFRVKASLNAEALMKGQLVRILSQRSSSFLAGFELYSARLDKGYSLTDCISMKAMRSEGITQVLTNDVHFEQEGFRALLRTRG